MPSPQNPKTQENVTPREFFEVIQLGTGNDFDCKKSSEYIEKYGERADEIVQRTRQNFTELIGCECAVLSSIASKGAFPNSVNYNSLQDQIRANLVEKLEFLKTYVKEHREAGLRRMGTEANNYLDRLTAYYFPGEESVQMNSEVEICNDAASLIMLAFNDQVNPKVKFEAARKLLLMKYIGEIRNPCNQTENEDDNDDALHYMMRLFNERILELSEGAKIGSTTPRYLLSIHDIFSYKTEHTQILDSEPNNIDENGLTKVTKLPSRKTTVIGKDGKEREIYFSLDPREKGAESRLTKTLRYGCQIGEKDVDRNGLRLVFENREDWEDFFRMFKEEIKSEVREGLCERLEADVNKNEMTEILARLDNLDSSIIIPLADVKDSLGNKKFNGNAPSSSRELKVLKFKMRVTRADGRQHTYEFQIFLPDGFADAKYRKGVSWEEYHADRFFQAKVDQLLFPEHIYRELDREKAHEKVMKRAHQKAWNGQPH